MAIGRPVTSPNRPSGSATAQAKTRGSSNSTTVAIVRQVPSTGFSLCPSNSASIAGPVAPPSQRTRRNSGLNRAGTPMSVTSFRRRGRRGSCCSAAAPRSPPGCRFATALNTAIVTLN
ncbi:hypothetical protein L3Q67_29360 [Saccharothrix sp. AJ9571]|nr:hypothetical protein L3Q67_29360 [Saccharothrix sp. AJ9571]